MKSIVPAGHVLFTAAVVQHFFQVVIPDAEMVRSMSGKRPPEVVWR